MILDLYVQRYEVLVFFYHIIFCEHFYDVEDLRTVHHIYPGPVHDLINTHGFGTGEWEVEKELSLRDAEIYPALLAFTAFADSHGHMADILSVAGS